MNQLVAPEEGDIYWTAGLLEGRATFCVRSGEPARPRVVTLVRDSGVAEWLRDAWGAGTLYRKDKSTAWELTGENAAQMMLCVYASLGADNQSTIRNVLERCGYVVPDDPSVEVGE